MYTYIYIYIYIYAYVCVCMYTCMCVYTPIHIYIYIYTFLGRGGHQEGAAADRLSSVARWRRTGDLCVMSTANVYTYTPIMYNTLYIISIRHCKHLLVVVYKPLSRIMHRCHAIQVYDIDKVLLGYGIVYCS